MAKKCFNHPLRDVWAQGLCHSCYQMKNPTVLKKYPLKPISERQKTTLLIYRMRRRKYLRENPICEIGLGGCTKVATEIHHTAKKYSQNLWLDTEKFKAVCRHCHRTIEDSPRLAKQLGLYEYKI